MLVTYDVSTSTAQGRRRLRREERACLDFGQRVRLSVFEWEVDPAQWVSLRARLIAEINPATDSLRLYRLGTDGRRRLEHVGARPFSTVCLIGLMVYLMCYGDRRSLPAGTGYVPAKLINGNVVPGSAVSP